MLFILDDLFDTHVHARTRLQFDRVLQKVASVVPGPKPTHIFEVFTPHETNAEEKFRGYKQNFSSTFGFHGSKLESFHSILNYGLQQHLCKEVSTTNHRNPSEFKCDFSNGIKF